MTIYFKQGDHYFLSNFHEEPFYMEGKLYRTAEHAYQASKSSSEIGHNWIRKAVSPNEAKRLGKQVAMRVDWDLVKIIIMKKVVTAKFAHSKYLQQRLLDTNDEELVEYTYWGDRFWGVDANLEGRNELGKILMEVRKYFINSKVVKV